MSNPSTTTTTTTVPGNGSDVIVKAVTPLQEYESGLTDGQQGAISEAYALGTKAGRRAVGDALLCKAMKASDVKDARAALQSKAHKLIMAIQ